MISPHVWVGEATWIPRLLGLDGSCTVSPSPIGDGRASETIRLTLLWHGGSSDATPRPSSLVLKQTPADRAGSRVSGALALERHEERFYDELAPALPVRVPRCLGAGVHPDTGARVLLLEDVPQLPGHRARQDCDAGDAAAILTEAARLHAMPVASLVAHHAWLRQGTAARRAFLARTPRTFLPALLPRLGDLLSPSASHTLHRLAEGRPEPVLEPVDLAFVHGDLRADNVIFTPDGVCLLDWQTYGLDCAMRDVAYLLGTSLRADERRRHVTDLLEHYRTQRASAGRPIDNAHLRRGYLAGARDAVAFVLAATVMVDPAPERSGIFVTMIERSTSQLRDLLGEPQLSRV